MLLYRIEIVTVEYLVNVDEIIKKFKYFKLRSLKKILNIHQTIIIEKN